jgi:hypothetical protein
MKNGRPKILITCDQLDGIHSAAEWSVKTGIGYFSIMSGIKRGRPVGKNKLIFRRYSPSFEDWRDERMWDTFERQGDEANQIVFGPGSVSGEKIDGLGFSVSVRSHFEDIEGAFFGFAVAMLDRNPLRDEFFEACIRVLPMIG